MRGMAGPTRPHATRRPVEDQCVRANILSASARTKVWLELDGRFFIGDGGLRLLLAIRETGSLAAALRLIGWSYRHGWGYLRRAERALGAALTRSRPGKGAARGAVLTPPAELLVKRLLRLRRQLDGLTGTGGPTAEEVATRGQRRRGR
jgi:molybdate transport system regulatory protein